MHAFTARLGWPILLILSFIPVVLWLNVQPFSERFVTAAIATTSMGQLLGLTGMAMFALAMILSTRLPVFESFFGGMNRVYIVHHQLGGISFILLMLHPMFLVVTYLTNSIYSAALFLLPGEDWAINFGIAALLFLMALLVFTYYADLPYELWRFTHKFLGGAFFLGGLHSFFIPSDISRDPVLRGYMLTLVGVGLVGYLYRTVLGRFLVPRLRYVVSDMKTVGKGIIEIVLTPADNRVLSFLPGQFVFISFIGRGVNHETHPFSISSVPQPTGFTLTVKSLGDWTNRLAFVPPGTQALIEGPFGRFSYAFSDRNEFVWIAGGIGITPFVSMARSVTPKTGSVDLYYSVRDESEAVYLTELTELAGKNPNMRIIPWYSTTGGRLTAEAIEKTSGALANKEIYVCGPPAMMRSIKHQLRKMGVATARIHSEEFAML